MEHKITMKLMNPFLLWGLLAGSSFSATYGGTTNKRLVYGKPPVSEGTPSKATLSPVPKGTPPKMTAPPMAKWTLSKVAAPPASNEATPMMAGQSQTSKVGFSDRCGPQLGLCGADNPYGSCCSSAGYCGKTEAYCHPDNCSSGCWEATEYSSNDRCGAANNGLMCDPNGAYGGCCSKAGYCGSSMDYCSANNCVSGCPATPVFSSTDRCGSANLGLMCNPNGEFGGCCSKAGYCGATQEYCNPTNCQSGCLETAPLLVKPPQCGDGFCDGRKETCFSCPADCGPCDLSYTDKCTSPGQISLTFDDGPDRDSLNLLSTAKKLGVKLTVFVVGQKLASLQNQNSLLRLYRDGHTIASHTFTHPFMTQLTDDQLRQEMRHTDDAIFKVIGQRPRYMRNPYADTNTRVMALLQSMGYISIFTSLDTRDTEVASIDPNLILQNVKDALAKSNRAQDSFILTQHETYNSSINFLPSIVKEIRQRGYRISHMNSCLRSPSAYRNEKCGDGKCSGYTEDCQTCPKDCGTCPIE